MKKEDLPGHITVAEHLLYTPKESQQASDDDAVTLMLLARVSFMSAATMTMAMVDECKRFQSGREIQPSLHDVLASLTAHQLDALARGDVGTCASWAQHQYLHLPEQMHADVPGLWIERINMTWRECTELIADPPTRWRIGAAQVRRQPRSGVKWGSRWIRIIKLVDGVVEDPFTVLRGPNPGKPPTARQAKQEDRELKAFVHRVHSRLQNRSWVKRLQDTTPDAMGGLLAHQTRLWQRGLSE